MHRRRRKFPAPSPWAIGIGGSVQDFPKQVLAADAQPHPGPYPPSSTLVQSFERRADANLLLWPAGQGPSAGLKPAKLATRCLYYFSVPSGWSLSKRTSAYSYMRVVGYEKEHGSRHGELTSVFRALKAKAPHAVRESAQ